MAKIEWTEEKGLGGLKVHVGAVEGVRKYFVARDDETAQLEGRPEGLWRVALNDGAFARNPAGELKWFARVGSGKEWAARQEH